MKIDSSSTANVFDLYEDFERLDNFDQLMKRVDALLTSGKTKAHFYTVKEAKNFSVFSKNAQLRFTVYGDLKPTQIKRVENLAHKHGLKPKLDSPFLNAKVAMSRTLLDQGVSQNPNRVMRHWGYPLYDHKKSLFFFHNPKCGSSFLKYLFMNLVDDQAAVDKYSSCVHRWSCNIHAKAINIRPSKMEAAIDRYFTAVAVRNPFSRVVSAFLDSPNQNEVMRQVASALGISYKKVLDISFSDFISALENMNLATCEPHLRTQLCAPILQNPRYINYIAKVERLSDDVLFIYKACGYPKDKEALVTTSRHFKDKVSYVKDWDCSHVCLKDIKGCVPGDETGKAYPHTLNFYTPELVQRVQKLYGKDIKALGYKFEDI